MQTTRPGIHPHEIVMAGMSAGSGIVELAFQSNASSAITNAFPGWFYVMFFGGLILGGLATLYGISRDKLEGVLIERAGLALLSAMYLAYAIAVVGLFGERGVMASVMPLAVAIANAVRVWQIGRSIKLYRDG